MFVTIITGITLLFAGGASFIAEYSQPGDVFYPIKIHVNENVASAIVIGSEGEAKLQLSFIRDRINERNQLSQEGILNNQIDADIKNQIMVYAERFDLEVKKLESDGKISLASNLKQTFENIIAAVETNNGSDSPQENTFTNTLEEIVYSNNKTTEPEVSSNSNIGFESETNITDFKINSEVNIDAIKTLPSVDVDVASELKSNLNVNASSNTPINSTMSEPLKTLGDKLIKGDTSQSIENLENF